MFLWEKGWGLGIWLLQGWFGLQILTVKIVICRTLFPNEISPILPNDIEKGAKL